MVKNFLSLRCTRLRLLNEIFMSKTIGSFISLLKSNVAKNSLIVFLGNALGSAFRLVAIVIITRMLGPSQFGLFSIALAIMIVVPEFSDFGVNIGLVRFASLYLQKDKLKAYLLFKVSLKLKLIAGILVLLTGLLLSELLAVRVFNKVGLITPLKLAFIGAFGTLLVNYILVMFQAQELFNKYSFTNIIDNFGKFSLIALLLLFQKLNLFSAFSSFVTIPFIVFLIGFFFFIPKDFLWVKGNEKECFRELFRFSKWILISSLTLMFIRRLDILMLSYFKDEQVVGFYSAGFTLAWSFEILIRSFVTVLLPKVSKLTTNTQLIQYTKKSLSFTIPIFLCLSPVFFIGKPLVLKLYGIEYESSINVFKLLVIGRLATIISSPIGLLALSINKPQIISYSHILLLLMNFIGYYFLIPPYGATGAAIVNLLSRMISSSFVIICLYFNIKFLKRDMTPLFRN